MFSFELKIEVNKDKLHCVSNKLKSSMVSSARKYEFSQKIFRFLDNFPSLRFYFLVCHINDRSDISLLTFKKAHINKSVSSIH